MTASGPPPKAFDMDGARAAGILLEHRHRVGAAFAAIGGVELHDHFGLGVAEEQVPCGDAVDLFEIVRVGMVAHPHAISFDLIADVIEELGPVQPLLL
jgi:hypothetical protein